MAIGARPADVLWMILLEGMALAAARLAAGLLAALATERLIASYLYGVLATDMTTFAGAASFLAAVACLACLVPARQAADSEPAKIHRHD